MCTFELEIMLDNWIAGVPNYLDHTEEETIMLNLFKSNPQPSKGGVYIIHRDANNNACFHFFRTEHEAVNYTRALDKTATPWNFRTVEAA